MKVLVTGGTGFLGRHLVWRLASEGHDVGFTGRDASKAREVVSRSARPVTVMSLSHDALSLPTLASEDWREIPWDLQRRRIIRERHG